MPYAATVAGTRYAFADLKTLLARATPLRSGDVLGGIAAADATERVAAQLALADLPLNRFLAETVIPYEVDEVTRLIVDTHDAAAFAPVAALTVGEFRDWLLSDSVDAAALARLAPGLTPEMAAAVSKIMRLQDLIAVAAKCTVVTRFRNTIGLPGTLSTRLQPNHPTDDLRGIAASILDGLMLGSGDAVIGINPATDSLDKYLELTRFLDMMRERLGFPGQSCVLAHVTTALAAIGRGAPVDLVFQSIAGTEAANRNFGIDLALLREGREAVLSLGRGTLGQNAMYFETGQGSALSAEAHHGVDQQTLEARAYAVARAFDPLLVNSVVGFIGPEYLFDGKQIARAGLEDHFCGKLLGLPMGVDVCYTNHAEADQDDMDALLTLLGVAGCTYIMGVPGADDVMLGYQSSSFHDALYLRRALGKRPAPEFEKWLQYVGLADANGDPTVSGELPALMRPVLARWREKGAGVNWLDLRRATPARIALGRTGGGLPTVAHLDFQRAHALARDAVYAALDVRAIVSGLADLGLEPIRLRSAASDRATYLRRPDLGRRLDAGSRALPIDQDTCEVVFVIADGLSATAVNRHAVPVIQAALAQWGTARPRLGPVAVIEGGRVAIGAEIGGLFGADLVAVLIGERPGLSAADSLGIYVTWQPAPGAVDSARNCLSNIRPEGMPIADAAEALIRLIAAARRYRMTGIGLSQRLALKTPAEPP